SPASPTRPRRTDAKAGSIISCAKVLPSTIPTQSSAAAPAGRNTLTSSRASRCSSRPPIRSSVSASATAPAPTNPIPPRHSYPREGYAIFLNTNVPRWPTPHYAIVPAYIAGIDRVGPSIILFHSQAGTFGFKVAQARPDKVKALIAVEPAGVGDPAHVDVLK